MYTDEYQKYVKDFVNKFHEMLMITEHYNNFHNNVDDKVLSFKPINVEKIPLFHDPDVLKTILSQSYQEKKDDVIKYLSTFKTFEQFNNH